MHRSPRNFLRAAITAGVSFTVAATIAAAPASAQLSSTNIANAVTGSSNSVTQAVSASEAVRHSITVNGMKREYLLALPQNFDPVRTYPVILAFGGWQHTADGMRSYANIEGATSTDALVVYAQGVDNAWAGAPYASTTLAQDLDYVDALIDELVYDYSARRDEVYAVGMSNGGGIAVALACHTPHLVKAVSTVAGAHYDPTVADCAAGQVPTQIIHGTADDVISYVGGTRHGAGYRSVDEVFGILGQKNGCDMTALNYVNNADNTTTFTPRSCLTDTEVIRVNGGGHTWFTQPNATELAVDFFGEL